MKFKWNGLVEQRQRIMAKIKPWYKKITALTASILILFFVIGVLTTIQPGYRLSSSTINDWTRQIAGSSFLHLMQMENRALGLAYPEDAKSIEVSELVFEMATSLKPNDPRSLLGRELPGFNAYDSKIIVAGEGTDYTNLPIESSAPLDVVLEDRDVKDEPEPSKPDKQPDDDQPTTGDRDVVFIYNSHNRESFLPHLDGVSDADHAHHSELNIGRVSERLEEGLEANGIGTQVDQTDVMNILNEKGWEYWQSYTASKPIVEEALASNTNIQYVFDLHRDSIDREHTTTTIDGKTYGKLAFVVGEDYKNEKNLQFATMLHEKIKEKYPSLTRGVIQQGGQGNNGVYNQNLNDNSILIEVGGVDNSLEELYRTVDILADEFSDYYWDAEKVQGNQ
ncbi:stage II sporulation protein P [Aquibacillus sediminis]|uniref:stage II sporulation protein P n=1 Tax=Aquibacillus sediminis TaxID=2574734 RepID=UPI001FE42CF7|nr:stage II sporulation protein P [Aquibacillus sediminis]